MPLVEGRDLLVRPWALMLLADARRLLGDEAAEATALRAQASGEELGNRLFATSARLTLGRLAAPAATGRSPRSTRSPTSTPAPRAAT